MQIRRFNYNLMLNRVIEEHFSSIIAIFKELN